MRGWREVSWIVISLALAATPAMAAGNPARALAALEQTEQAFEVLARRVQPAVVNIRRFVPDSAWWAIAHTRTQLPAGWRVVSESDLLYPGHRPEPGASGFLVSADGFIVTLRRVVVDASTGEEPPIIDVEVGATHYKANVISLEPTLDLAILKLSASAPFAHLKFGDSERSLAGHWAIAFGDPDGHETSLLPGVIAAQPSRECYQDELSATYLQTSVQVPDGALGGPLVNLRGEVIGINARRGASGTVQGTGSGFAVPANLAVAIYQSLLTRGSKSSPWLGISVKGLDDAIRKRLGDPALTGIAIDNVFDPSPACDAGIRIGDVLQSLNGYPIPSVYDFQRQIYIIGVGNPVKIGVLRDRKRMEFSTIVAKRPPEATTR